MVVDVEEVDKLTELSNKMTKCNKENKTIMDTLNLIYEKLNAKPETVDENKDKDG